MRFVEDDISVVEGTSSHVGERRNLNEPFFHIALEAFRAHDLIECIVERTQVRVDLALQIAGQKAELLACFDRRSGQNNALHLVIFKSGNRHCHRQVGFACSGRSQTEYDHLFPDRIHILLLSERFGLYRFSAHGVADEIAVYFK